MDIDHAYFTYLSSAEAAIAALESGSNFHRLEFEPYRDNSEVVIKALLNLPDGGHRSELIVHCTSERIKDLCSGKDPVQALKAELLAKHLTEELAPKPPSRSTKLKI